MTASSETIADSRTWLTHERAAKVLRWAAVAYAIAWAIHPGDHIRRGTGVTVFSWFAAIVEIVAALGFGIAGAYALQATRSRSVATAGEPAGA
jgi:hypothetical protein